MKNFKSATAYKLITPITAIDLAILNDHPVREPHETQLSVIGWRNALDEESEMLTSEIPSTGKPQYTLLCMVEVKRNIKPATIKREAAKRIKLIEAKTGKRMTRHEKLAITEEVVADAIPGALTEEHCTLAYIDHALSLIVINESSVNKCEKFLLNLMRIVESLAVIPVCTKYRPDAVMNEWLVGSTEPPHIEIQGNAIFKDPLDMSKTAKLKHVAIDSEVIGKVLEEGMIPQELDLLWSVSDHIQMSFVLTDTLSIKSIELTGLDDDDAGEYATDEEMNADESRRTEASLIVSFSILSEVFKDIFTLFGGVE